MNCRGASRRLSAFIDEQLSPAIRQSVEEHIKGCVRCRQKLAEFEVISKVAHSLPALKVSEGFADRVLGAFRAEPKTKEVFGKISYRLAMASAAFTMAAAVVFFAIGPSPGEVGTTVTDIDDKTIHEMPVQQEPLDFTGNPRVIVYTVPVPEDILARDKILDDSLLLADTASKIDRFVLPEVDKGLKVNKKF